jgi:hypothetical protein
MTDLLMTIAASIAAPDKDAMMAKEKAAWQVFKDKNAADFKKVVAAHTRLFPPHAWSRSRWCKNRRIMDRRFVFWV